MSSRSKIRRAVSFSASFVIGLIVATSWTSSKAAFAIDPVTLPLVQAGNLAYSGSFRLPAFQTDQTSFAYGGTAMAFNPSRGTLFAVGHNWYQLVAEINIPQIRTSSSLDALDRATYRQQFKDVLLGRLNDLGPGSVLIGGLLPNNTDLIVSAYRYYDGDGSQAQSHFKSSTEFGQISSVGGPYQIANAQAGFVSGYMTRIPVDWQSALGGDLLAGQCCIPIVSRTSFGPSVTVINVADVGRASPVPGTRVLGYPIAHPTIGDWGSSGTLFNGGTAMGGAVFARGSRSVLFFGRRGVGPFCYGEGTSSNPPGVDAGGIPKCYDPSDSSKGTHSYPYETFVWAYDAADLVAVKEGRKQTWDVLPYATWSLRLPFESTAKVISGVAYDPDTQRIFLSAGYSDGPQPVVHVFNVTNALAGLCR